MRDFPELYRGRENTRGIWHTPAQHTPKGDGKLGKGRVTTSYEPVTPDLFEKHIRGEIGLGICPILEDGTVWWFCIDVDVYENIHEKLAQEILHHGLPLVMTVSRSGGAHLWCHLQEPIHAREARTIMARWVVLLGLRTKYDLFPRQDTITDGAGNWINLPFYGGTRLGLADDGKTVISDPDEWVRYVNTRLASMGDIRQLESKRDDFAPCLGRMEQEGLGEGGRNNAAWHVGMLYKKAWPDEWEEKLFDWNERVCNPKLAKSELGKVVASVRKTKTMGLKCKEQPMASLCDMPTCLKRKYGIGSVPADGDGEYIVFDEIYMMINGDSCVYNIKVHGVRLPPITAEELKRFDAFQTKYMVAHKKLIPSMSKKTWEENLSIELQKCIDRTPKDVRPEYVIQVHLEDFVRNCPVFETLEEATHNDVKFMVDGYIYFSLSAFMRFLDANKTKLTRGQVANYLIELGAWTTATGSVNRFVWDNRTKPIMPEGQPI